jgi:hypothetical protein
MEFLLDTTIFFYFTELRNRRTIGASCVGGYISRIFRLGTAYNPHDCGKKENI